MPMSKHGITLVHITYPPLRIKMEVYRELLSVLLLLKNEQEKVKHKSTFYSVILIDHISDLIVKTALYLVPQSYI